MQTLALDYNQASAHIAALTGSPDTIVDLRALHDTNKAVPGIPMRGRLSDLWQAIVAWNMQGYGVFIVVNETNGQGRKIDDFVSIRAHFTDLDDVNTSAQSYNSAASMYPAPSFAVVSSPNKFHIYWPTGQAAYLDRARFDTIQSKLIAAFNGDTNSRDLARVLRLAGTYHCKIPTAPTLVTCHALHGYGYSTSPEALEAALAGVQGRDASIGVRHPLGDITQAAPSVEMAAATLNTYDPNQLDRGEWIAKIAAFKQSVSTLTDDNTAFEIFSRWCSRYTFGAGNDPAENLKQWNSIRETQLGWHNLKRGSALAMLGQAVAPAYFSAPPQAPVTQTTVQPEPVFNSELLTPQEQSLYFRNIAYCIRLGQFVDIRYAQFLDTGKFNAKFGGKLFIITDAGKSTDEPAKAALRSTGWTVPKFHNIRFLPHELPGATIMDEFDRPSINIYRPANIRTLKGDPTPFLKHLALVIPQPNDQRLYIEFLAHNAKYPGFKIPWAPLLQSAEGAGKKIIKKLISHVMGGPYVYFPNAKELIESGSKFNSWMRAKLFILVDEIKVDERRDMIEVLKPMISEEEIEIQGKGENQEKEDNYSNWAFFSNFPDAIPIHKNGRRFAIFYSAIQSNDDLVIRGMDQKYFDDLYDWLDRGGGKEIVADYLLNYPIERGAIPMRAPETTSTMDAIERSRGPLEQLLFEMVEDQRAGFRGGWVSTIAFKNAARAAGLTVRSEITFAKVLEGAGYQKAGRAIREYGQEAHGARATLYTLTKGQSPTEFGRLQGYE